jgi:hypothetical protein
MKGGWRAVGLRRRQDSDDHFAANRLEFALRMLLVYIVVGFVYTGTHIELLDQLENQLSAAFTVFADYAALAVMMSAWPLLLGSAMVCGVAGCGVI